MAESVAQVKIRAVIEGLQGFDRVASALKKLQTAAGPTEQQITAARRSILAFNQESNRSEQVIQGQIDSLKALAKEVVLGGSSYQKLANDIRTLEAELRGTTPALEQQRRALLQNVSANQDNAAALSQNIQQLERLRQQTRPGSSPYIQLGQDIEQARRRVTGITSELQLFNLTLNQPPGASNKVLTQQLGILQRNMQGLKVASDEYARSLERVNLLQTVQGQRGARQQAIASAAMYASEQYQGFVRGPLERFELPDTVAALRVRLAELGAELNNVVRGTERYLGVALEMASVQREASTATQGLGQALAAQLGSGELARSEKNLQEVIGQLRAEMRELDTSTAEGNAGYAQRASLVTELERDLQRLAGAYRSVGEAAREASRAPGPYDTFDPADGPVRNPATGQRNPGILSIGEKQDVEAAKEALNVYDGALAQLEDVLQSHRQQRLEIGEKFNRLELEQLDRLNDEALRANKQRFDQEIADFDQRLRQRDQVLQRRTALKNQFGMGGRDLSSLYQGIVDIGATGALSAADLMGNSYQQVASDIRAATAASDGSIGSLQRQRQSWEALRNTLSPLDEQYASIRKEANAAIRDIDRQMEKLNPQGLQGKVGYIGQGIGAIASAGFFGGPEGALAGALGGGIGGKLGGAAGFASGAFIGSSIGAYASQLRQLIAQTTEYSAAVKKQEIALKGVSGGGAQYEQAMRAVTRVMKDFNVPQLEATQGMTKLTAAVIGAGGKVSDAELVFRNVTAAIKATGGSAQDVEGALTALTQVFSKGKVSAEELQGQLGERLAGAVTMFAEATGRTLPQLQEDLQAGVVDLNDLMKFVVGLGDKYAEAAKKMGKSSADAGERLKTTFSEVRKQVGDALQPLGAELQDSLGNALREALPGIISSAKLIAAAIKLVADNFGAIASITTFAAKLVAVNFALKGLAMAGPLAARALALVTAGITKAKLAAILAGPKITALKTALAGFGKLGLITIAVDLAVTGLTELQSALAEAKALKPFSSADYTKELKDDSQEQLKDRLKESKELLEGYSSELDSIWLKWMKPVNVENLKFKILTEKLKQATLESLIPTALTDEQKVTQFQRRQEEEGRPQKMLDIIEQREEGIAQARQQYEEDLLSIRKAALDQVQQVERNSAKERLELEREAARIRRETAAIQQDTGLSQQARAASSPLERTLLQDQLEFGARYREFAEERIALEQQAQDRERDKLLELEDFKVQNAKSINEANERYAKAIGNIQLQYAKSVAKLVEEGGISSGRRLALAAQLSANYIERASANMQVLNLTGYAVSQPGGNPGFSVDKFMSRLNVFGLTPDGLNNLKAALEVIYNADQKISELNRKIASTPSVASSAAAATPRITSVSTTDIDRRYEDAVQSVIGSGRAKDAATQQQIDAKIVSQLDKDYASIAQSSIANLDSLREQNDQITAQAALISRGVNPELAKQLLLIDDAYRTEVMRINNATNSALAVAKEEGLRKRIQDARVLELGVAKANRDEAILLTQQLERQEQLLQDMIRTMQDMRIGEGFRDGINDYIESIGTMKEAVSQLTVNGIKGIEDAIFSLVTTGKANFREFAADILRQTARMIIQQLILRSIMQAIGFIGGGSSGLSNLNAPATINNPLGVLNANGNAFAQNGIIPFATGGIVDKPTLFKFANGGAMSTGVMGEAGPEAIIPLKRGRDGRLGVSGGGGGAPVTVNVSVDASGSQVQGNAGQSEQLGRAVAQAVQQELIRQKRPGGLIAA